MNVFLAILLMCTLPDGKNVKCELIGDTEIYKSKEECEKRTKKVNEKFQCLAVEVTK